uniref:Uncharacterized protein n=1 Tax=Glycine max TaxID=3847 RepID=I1MM79_SOYBN
MLFRVSPVFSSDGGAVVHFVVVQVPLQKKEGSEVRDFGFGCCRKEVCVDSLVEMITFVHWSNCSNMINCPSVWKWRDKSRVRRVMMRSEVLLLPWTVYFLRLVCRKRSSIPDVGLLSTSLIISLGRIKQSFVLTNPHLPDMAIVYASDAFLNLTGFKVVTLYKLDQLQMNLLIFSHSSYTSNVICSLVFFNYYCLVKRVVADIVVDDLINIRNSILVAYFVGVQIEDNNKNDDSHCLSPEKRQLSVVSVVKVAPLKLLILCNLIKSIEY